jgi:hypothetical protein
MGRHSNARGLNHTDGTNTSQESLPHRLQSDGFNSNAEKKNTNPTHQPLTHTQSGTGSTQPTDQPFDGHKFQPKAGGLPKPHAHACQHTWAHGCTSRQFTQALICVLKPPHAHTKTHHWPNLPHTTISTTFPINALGGGELA